MTHSSLETQSKSDDGLAKLEARVHQDLTYLGYPPVNWVPPTRHPGAEHLHVHDVVVVGGGMCRVVELTTRWGWRPRVSCVDAQGGAGDIPAISHGARWLAQSLAATFYREDIDQHWQALLDYDKPELQGDEWTETELPSVPISQEIHDGR